MDLPVIADALTGSEYEDRADCIEKTLANAGIETVLHLENAPRTLGSQICGHSIWEFIAFMRLKAEEAEEAQAEPAPPRPRRSRSRKSETEETAVKEEVVVKLEDAESKE